VVEIVRVLCALAILFSIVCEGWALLHLNWQRRVQSLAAIV